MGWNTGAFHTGNRDNSDHTQLRIPCVTHTAQHGSIQFLILAPVLTLCLLGLIVRSASSAVDHRIEKQKIAEQLRQRLSEVYSDPTPPRLSRPAPEPTADPPAVAEPAAAQVAAATAEQPSQPQSFPLQTTHTVRKKDTFETILRGQGLGQSAASTWITAWIAAAGKEKHVRNLQIDRRFSFVFDEGPEEPLLTSLSYDLSALSRLTLERRPDGNVTSRLEALPTSLVWRAVSGRITSSLYEAAVNTAGVPDRIVDEMIDLGWDFDFSSDLRAGDTFKVIFEEYQRDGQPVQYGRVLATEIVNQGKSSTVLSLDQTEGFLRYPLRFTRISSVFTKARFHPVLKRHRPHNGVDFAAPRGTPVRAVANGRVTCAGWEGGFGRLVRIDHPGAYSTEYAHLHSIAKGIRVGGRVKRGQKIGSVGSTGLATGPHLHFGLFKNGRYVNPLSANLPRVPKTDTRKPDPVRAKLKKTLTEYLARLEPDQASTFAAVETTKPPSRPRS